MERHPTRQAHVMAPSVAMRLTSTRRKHLPFVVAMDLEKDNVIVRCRRNIWLAVPRRTHMWRRNDARINAPCGWDLCVKSSVNAVSNRSYWKGQPSPCMKISNCGKAVVDRIEDMEHIAVRSALSNPVIACSSFPDLSSCPLPTTIGWKTHATWQCLLRIESRHRT